MIEHPSNPGNRLEACAVINALPSTQPFCEPGAAINEKTSSAVYHPSGKNALQCEYHMHLCM